MRNDWTLTEAVRQIADGDPRKTEDAADWIYEFIAEEVAAQHPLMLGAIAETLLNALVNR